MMGFLHLHQLPGPFFPAAFLLDLIEIGSEVVRPFVQSGIHFVQLCQISLSLHAGSDTGCTAQYGQLVLDRFPLIGIIF